MKKSIISLCITMLLVSCVSTFQFVNAPAIVPSDNKMATIYVLRPKSFASAVKIKILQGDTVVGKLGPKSYLSWNVDPSAGEVEITSKSENTVSVSIKPEAGKSYFINQKVKMGLVRPRTKIELLETKEGDALLSELKKPIIKAN